MNSKNNSSVLEYLQKKSQEDNQYKREELEFKKQELQLAKQKLELERQKFEFESSERTNQMSMLYQIIQEKILK